MKKYIVEEPKLVALLNNKMMQIMAESAEIFSKLNPNLSLQIELNDQERELIGELQRGNVTKEQIPKELVEKIDRITEELERVETAEKEGNLNMDILSLEDMRRLLTFTDEELLSVLHGPEKE